jgi:hypothetical protein
LDPDERAPQGGGMIWRLHSIGCSNCKYVAGEGSQYHERKNPSPL